MSQAEAKLPYRPSDELARLLAAGAREGISLGQVLDAAGQRSFWLLLSFLALPPLAPLLPPGTSIVVGLLIAFVAGQRAAGRRRPWVPAGVRRWRLPRAGVRGLRERVLPLLAKLEGRAFPPRAAARAEAADRLLAGLAALMGILVAIPLPLLNSPPALAVLLLSLGALQLHRGLLWAGVGLGAVLLGALAWAVLLSGAALSG